MQRAFFQVEKSAVDFGSCPFGRCFFGFYLFWFLCSREYLPRPGSDAGSFRGSHTGVKADSGFSYAQACARTVADAYTGADAYIGADAYTGADADARSCLYLRGQYKHEEIPHARLFIGQRYEG
jgi:hypothetical protein